MDFKFTNSLDNPIINTITSLHQTEERKKRKLFLIEEFDILFEALKNGFQIETLLYCPNLISENEVSRIKYDGSLIALTKSIYENLTLNSNSGIIAVMRSNLKIINDYGKSIHFIPKNKLNDIKLNEKPIIILAYSENILLYLENLLKISQKTTITLVFTKEVDIYQPKLIKTYKDSIFSTQVIFEYAKNILNFAKRNYLELQQLNLENFEHIMTKNHKNKIAYLIGNLNCN